jgi:excinuclease ABC subunit C
MQLEVSVLFGSDSEGPPFFDVLPSGPAVFALFPETITPSPAPYLSRTRDLRRRLTRLLGKPSTGSKRLNLRDVTRRVEYQGVGSIFEAQWLLYLLNKVYYPRTYRQRLRLKPPALLKVNLRNRFPRCYPTRRLANDGSLYYGPFANRVAAERFASEFLDLFKIRRCVEDLNPDPAHPGCIYSQMHMCLAPCFAGCTDDEYQQELSRVVTFLNRDGHALVRSLEEERACTADSLDFEQAGKIHRKLEKIQAVLRLKSGLVRRLDELHAVMLQPAAQPRSVALFRIAGGELRGPATLSFDENVASPLPLDAQLQALLDSLARPTPPEGGAAHVGPPPSWEPLNLLARWYYSSFREGELVMLPPSEEIPYTRLIRLCRKMVQRGDCKPALRQSP